MQLIDQFLTGSLAPNSKRFLHWSSKTMTSNRWFQFCITTWGWARAVQMDPKLDSTHLPPAICLSSSLFSFFLLICSWMLLVLCLDSGTHKVGYFYTCLLLFRLRYCRCSLSLPPKMGWGFVERIGKITLKPSRWDKSKVFRNRGKTARDGRKSHPLAMPVFDRYSTFLLLALQSILSHFHMCSWQVGRDRLSNMHSLKAAMEHLCTTKLYTSTALHCNQQLCKGNDPGLMQNTPGTCSSMTMQFAHVKRTLLCMWVEFILWVLHVTIQITCYNKCIVWS